MVFLIENRCFQLSTDSDTERQTESDASNRDEAASSVAQVDEAFFDSLQALREKISKRRNGRPIDVDRIISQIRQERGNAFDG